ncbi:hypothetical protein HZA26_02075 [Candidatus Nomurabacteria bacterium]|nr:hypothetical protein [Candidatus Nomurabacteria bacterium]
MEHIKNHKHNDNNQVLANSTDAVEVLYQKLGDQWFAFSVVNGEVFWGKLASEIIEPTNSSKPIYKKTPRSS